MRHLKSWLFVLIISSGYDCFSQAIQSEKPTVQNHSSDSELNQEEIILLNSILSTSGDTLSFNQQKVAFVTGSAGSKILDKKAFFATCITPWVQKNETPQMAMLRLDEEETEASGGYDVLLLAWVKMLPNKTRNEIVKTLGKDSN